MKHGIMQQLLTGKTRLPGFDGEWREWRLGELLAYEQPTRYLVTSSKQLSTGRIPVLTAGKTFILGYTNDLHGVFTEHPVIIFDDFTTASKYVDFPFKAKSSAMKILRARAGTNLRFVYERMQLIDFSLGDHKRYWISEYSQLPVTAPGLAEQDAIAAVLADVDAEIVGLRDRLRKAKNLKQGVVQQLLTGRTRLPIREAVT
jgi:type I restriction enzyme S subunit